MEYLHQIITAAQYIYDQARHWTIGLSGTDWNRIYGLSARGSSPIPRTRSRSHLNGQHSGLTDGANLDRESVMGPRSGDDAWDWMRGVSEANRSSDTMPWTSCCGPDESSSDSDSNDDPMRDWISRRTTSYGKPWYPSDYVIESTFAPELTVDRHEQPKPQPTMPSQISEDPDHQCCVCFEPTSRNQVLSPCGHTQYCDTCIDKINVCALCRANITGRIRIH
mgnify:CR=1 FL=1